MIEVKNLVKKYGNHLAVDHVNFTIEEGQIYGFLGPNGAGKSTTMNMITGYIGATEGDVIINGINILEHPEKAKKCIGYLPEIPPLYVDMTVIEYLTFVAQLKKIPKKQIDEAVEEVCVMVGLIEVAFRLIKNLSKGYRQRVGLAGAIIGFPDIIILDEPMVGLDPKQIIEVRELIRTLGEKHTVIISSHILAEIREICDRVIIIAKGKVVANDTPEHLESTLEAQEIIEVEIRTEDESLVSILDTVEGICSYSSHLEDGVLSITIESDGKNADICEDLALLYANNRTPLRKLNVNKASLEDIFLKLTGKGETEELAQEETEIDEIKKEDN